MDNRKIIPQEINLKLCDLLRYIEIELSKDWGADNINDYISIAALAKRMNMSVRSLTSYFKLYTDQSLGKYIASRRAEYAARIFRLFPQTSTAEVSRVNGFFNPPALYLFLKKYGVHKPSDLRKPIPLNIRLEFRKEVLDTSYMVFKLRYGQYDNCNSVEFEENNWQLIENSIPYATPSGYVGIAIDNYLRYDEHSGAFMAGVIFDHEIIKVPKEFGVRIMNRGQYVVFTHKGAYSLLPAFYNSVISFLQNTLEFNVELDMPIFEKYLNSPTDTASEELITELWVPIKQ